MRILDPLNRDQACIRAMLYGEGFGLEFPDEQAKHSHAIMIQVLPRPNYSWDWTP